MLMKSRHECWRCANKAAKLYIARQSQNKKANLKKKKLKKLFAFPMSVLMLAIISFEALLSFRTKFDSSGCFWYAVIYCRSLKMFKAAQNINHFYTIAIFYMCVCVCVRFNSYLLLLTVYSVRIKHSHVKAKVFLQKENPYYEQFYQNNIK